ncbi:hypothetical protein GS432_20410 [Rhodococcus hoagii]|nr:hypothetical protein [Prescottella equi]
MRSRPSDVRSQQGGRVEFELPAQLHARIVELARAHDASVFMVMPPRSPSCWPVSRHRGRHRRPPIAGRGAAALDDMVGMFVNTLVLRCAVAAAVRFAELLHRVREADLVRSCTPTRRSSGWSTR